MRSAGRQARAAPSLAAAEFVAAPAVAVLLAYTLVYPIHGVHVPLGSDTPVYVWWARRTGYLGMRAFEAGGRPVIIGAIAALSSATRIPVQGVSAVVGPVLAAALGLVAAALTDLGLGGHRIRFALVTLFTGLFLALLVTGYFSTIAFGTMFVAALACLAHGLSRDEWAPVVAAGLLIGAAGLAHPLFLALGGLLLAGGGAALIPAMRRDLRGGVPLARTGLARVAMAGLGGLAVTGVGLLSVGPGARVEVDTSRDAILRTVGLGRLSRESYVSVLHHFFPAARAVPELGLTALGAVHLARRSRRRARSPNGDGSAPRSRGNAQATSLFWGVIGAWAVVTIGGVVGLFVGIPLPGQRLAAFCLAIPILAAVGATRLPRLFSRWRRGLTAALAAALAAAFLVASWTYWGAERPLLGGQGLRQLGVAATALASQPPGTPLILIYDYRLDEPGLVVARLDNYLRDVVSPERIPDVHVFLGSPADLLLGQPTLTGQREHDLIATRYWQAVEPLIRRGALAVVADRLDPPSFDAALELPQVAADRERYLLSPGVIMLPSLTGVVPLRALATSSIRPNPRVGPISPWLPVWLAPLVLAMLALVGWGWAFAAVPHLVPRLRLALAPAFGLASIGFAGMMADAAHIRLLPWGGLAATTIALAVGLGAAGIRRRSWPGAPPADRARRRESVPALP